MNAIRVLLAALLMAAAGPARAAERDDARAWIVAGSPEKAVPMFSLLAERSDDPELIGEYAYALWSAGAGDLAFAQLDRAAQDYAWDARFLYYAATLLSSAGLTDAGKELARPAPIWLEVLASTEPVPAQKAPTDFPLSRAFDAEFAAARLQLESRRYYSAAYRFHRLSGAAADNALVWAGYSLALEKIGAFKAAAKAAGRDAALSAGLDESARKLLAERQAQLLARRPVAAVKANAGLRGRLLFYAGGNFDQVPGETTWNVNTRAGKFLTDRVDAAVFLGWIERRVDDTRDGLVGGLSLRYQQPLSQEMPLSGTLAARVAHAAGADKDRTGVILSPGLSWFTEGGSIDFTFDVPVAGALKDAKTLSVGYSHFFGGYE